MQVEIDFGYLNTLSSVLSRVHFSNAHVNFIKCTIAGGAIRDMLLQKPVADIDVFYEGELDDKKLSTWFKTVKTTDTTYPDGFNVTYKVSWATIPVPIQLIQVKNIDKHIESFPSPLCRVQYDVKKGLKNIDMDFVDDVANKVFTWDSNPGVVYFDKIKSKYSDWKHTFLDPEYDPYHDIESIDLEF